MKIYHAQVNHLENPVGFRMERTVFSWKIKEAKGKQQSYARIRVSSDEAMEHLLFDSGEDTKASSLCYPVKLELEPRTRYYWTVEAGSDAGEKAVSEVQFFETGKRQASRRDPRRDARGRRRAGAIRQDHGTLARLRNQSGRHALRIPPQRLRRHPRGPVGNPLPRVLPGPHRPAVHRRQTAELRRGHAEHLAVHAQIRLRPRPRQPVHDLRHANLPR